MKIGYERLTLPTRRLVRVSNFHPSPGRLWMVALSFHVLESCICGRDKLEAHSLKSSRLVSEARAKDLEHLNRYHSATATG
jgi:hypothetical protein